jgi:hypothetical protein
VGVTSFSWSEKGAVCVRVLVPIQGNIFVQDGTDEGGSLRLIYDKTSLGGIGAIDPQLSPNGLVSGIFAK